MPVGEKKESKKKKSLPKSDYSHPDEVEAIVSANHGNPFAFLGMHEIEGGGLVVRVFNPYAKSMQVVRASARDAVWSWTKSVSSQPCSMISRTIAL